MSLTIFQFWAPCKVKGQKIAFSVNMATEDFRIYMHVEIIPIYCKLACTIKAVSTPPACVKRRTGEHNENMKKLHCVANLVTIHQKSLPVHKLTRKSGPTFSKERFCIFLSKKYAYFGNKNIKFLRIRISHKISHIATAKIISHKRMQLATFG